MTAPDNARRMRALPLVAGAALLVATVTACGSDESGTTAIDVDDAQVDEVVDSVDDAADDVAGEVDASSEELAQTLRDNGLDSIAGVVEQVDVSEWLGEGDFTFFAPNNEAFLGLSADQAADLLTDPAQILDVLRNHTVSSTVMADELTAMESVETQAGETLEVSSADGEVLVADVVVVSTDIGVGGGVIHVVDGLLLP